MIRFRSRPPFRPSTRLSASYLCTVGYSTLPNRYRPSIVPIQV